MDYNTKCVLLSVQSVFQIISRLCGDVGLYQCPHLHFHSRKVLLFQWTSVFPMKDYAKPHSAPITEARLRNKRVRGLDLPAHSPDLSLMGNVGQFYRKNATTMTPDSCTS